LLEHVRAERLTGYVLFDADYIKYFTGFNFLATERPVVFAQSAAGEMLVLVPEFEVERTRAETAFERVESYPEYPGIDHPMRILGRALADVGINRRRRRRPGWLSRHPRLPGAAAQRGRREQRSRRSARRSSR